MEHAVYPYSLLARNVLAEPRHWAAWAGFSAGYAGLLLGDSLASREASGVPSLALILLASVVPIVWPVSLHGANVSARLQLGRRLVGGFGFVLLALPLWTFAVHRVTFDLIGRLLLWAVLGTWVWATVASLARNAGSMAVLALLLSASVWLFPSRSVFRLPASAVSAPAAFLSNTEVQIAHLLLWSAVGGVGMWKLHRRMATGTLDKTGKESR